VPPYLRGCLKLLNGTPIIAPLSASKHCCSSLSLAPPPSLTAEFSFGARREIENEENQRTTGIDLCCSLSALARHSHTSNIPIRLMAKACRSRSAPSSLPSFASTRSRLRISGIGRWSCGWGRFPLSGGAGMFLLSRSSNGALLDRHSRDYQYLQGRKDPHEDTVPVDVDAVLFGKSWTQKRRRSTLPTMAAPLAGLPNGSA